MRHLSNHGGRRAPCIFDVEGTQRLPDPRVAHHVGTKKPDELLFEDSNCKEEGRAIVYSIIKAQAGL
jgi:hypothetical protein